VNRFELTDHAIQRYQERHDPAASYDEAREDLLALLEQAGPLRSRSIAGDVLWSCPGWVPRRARGLVERTVLLVTRADAGRVVVVTVLPAGAGVDLGEADAVLEEAEEMIAAYRRIEGLLEQRGTGPGVRPLLRGEAEATHGQLEELRTRAGQARAKLAKAQHPLARLVGRLAEEADRLVGGASGGSRAEQAKAETARLHELKTTREQLEAAGRRYQKLRAHADRMEADRELAKAALRSLGYWACPALESGGHPAGCAACGGLGYLPRVDVRNSAAAVGA